MGLFNFGKPRGESPQELAMKVQAAELEAQHKATQLEALQELVKHLDEDRLLLMRAAQEMRPRLDPKALGQLLIEISFKPLGLASCYLALVDWETDQLSFPIYHEGGRPRNQPIRSFSKEGGLTGKAIRSGTPLYIQSLEEARDAGALFSEAERVSGLVPQSWYGVPLGVGEGWQGPSFGLVSFQSFHKEAFSESRRRLMDALAAIVALALRAEPTKGVLHSGG